MLVDHADPQSDRVAWTGDPDFAPADADRARVRAVQAVEHVHQRRFAGAVLADERVDLTLTHDEVDASEGHQIAEPLLDAAHVDEHRRLGAHAWPSVS